MSSTDVILEIDQTHGKVTVTNTIPRLRRNGLIAFSLALLLVLLQIAAVLPVSLVLNSLLVCLVGLAVASLVYRERYVLAAGEGRIERFLSTVQWQTKSCFDLSDFRRISVLRPLAGGPWRIVARAAANTRDLTLAESHNSDWLRTVASSIAVETGLPLELPPSTTGSSEVACFVAQGWPSSSGLRPFEGADMVVIDLPAATINEALHRGMVTKYTLGALGCLSVFMLLLGDPLIVVISVVATVLVLALIIIHALQLLMRTTFDPASLSISASGVRYHGQNRDVLFPLDAVGDIAIEHARSGAAVGKPVLVLRGGSQEVFLGAGLVPEELHWVAEVIDRQVNREEYEAWDDN